MAKTVLITGANRGIGLELVKQYAKRGFAIIACCRDPQNAVELKTLSNTHHLIEIYSLDVSNESSIHQLSNQLKHSRIDILFNNAGIAGEDKALGSIVADDLISTFKVNTVGPVLMMQAFRHQVANSAEKKIVNMSSYLGSIELDEEGSWFWLSYRLSKSALNAASRCLAVQLKAQGITVIAMDPGWVKTEMGGKEADLTTAESVVNIIKVVEATSLDDSGQFIRFNGQYLPW